MAYCGNPYVEHVAIRVKDIDWHIRFFDDVLGMTVHEVMGSGGATEKAWTLGGMQFNVDPGFNGPEGRLAHLGIMVDWSGIDKVFGLGFGTAPAQAPCSRAHPPRRFLLHGLPADAPAAALLKPLAGHPVADTLFPLATVGAGLALLLGIGTRVAAVGGAILTLNLWFASLPLVQPVPRPAPVLRDRPALGARLRLRPVPRPGQRLAEPAALVRDRRWLY